MSKSDGRTGAVQVSPDDFLPDASSEPVTAPSAARVWRPSPERVVWSWPYPDERLVEDLG